MTRKQEGKPFSITTENHGDISVNFRHRALREPRLQIGVPQGGETVFFDVNTTRGRAVSFRQQEILRELHSLVGQRLGQQEQDEQGTTPTQSLVLADRLLEENLGRLDQAVSSSDTDNYRKHTKGNPLRRAALDNFHGKAEATIARLDVPKVLDAGCGEGFTLSRLQSHLPERQFEGLEYSEKAIRLGRDVHPDVAIRQGDIAEMPYSDNSFDLVTCFEVLEHLDDPQMALRELKRVTNRYCLLSVPNEPYFQLAHLLTGKNVKRLGNDREHIQHWSTKGFKQLVESEFNVLEVSNPALLWTMVLAEK